jgi:hypothetical protein
VKRRVVVTGVGVVTGYGLGRKVFWEGVKGGRSAVRAVDWAGRGTFPVAPSRLMATRVLTCRGKARLGIRDQSLVISEISLKVGSGYLASISSLGVVGAVGVVVLDVSVEGVSLDLPLSAGRAGKAPGPLLRMALANSRAAEGVRLLLPPEVDSAVIFRTAAASSASCFFLALPLLVSMVWTRLGWAYQPAITARATTRRLKTVFILKMERGVREYPCLTFPWRSVQGRTAPCRASSA